MRESDWPRYDLIPTREARTDPVVFRAGRIVDAAIAAIGGRDNVKTRIGEDDAVAVAEFGNGDVFLAEDGNQRILHIGGAARQFFKTAHLALAHGKVHVSQDRLNSSV